MRLIGGLLVLLLLTVESHCQSCPEGCFCSGIYATCSGYSQFPESFETTANIVSIHRSSLPVIPAHALRGARNVTEIYIYESVIGEIQNCAFKGLKGLVSLAIYNSDIITIRSGAFSNITFSAKENTRFAIYQANIETIEPFAFTDIANAKVFNIYQTNITLIDSLAFYRLAHMPFFSIYLSNITEMKTSAFKSFYNINYISIYSSFIEKLDCGTFDRFTSELGNGFSFYELEVNCDCNVAMLLVAARRNPAISISRTRCRGPSSVAGLALDAVNIPDICMEVTRTPNCQLPVAPYPDTCAAPRKEEVVISAEIDGASTNETTTSGIFATGNVDGVSQISATELNTLDSHAQESSTPLVPRNDSNITGSLSETVNDANDFGIPGNVTGDLSDDVKGLTDNVYFNKNNSVIIAIFSGESDLMSLLVTFLNYFFG